MKKLFFIFFALLFSSCLTEKRMSKFCEVAKTFCPTNQIDTVIIRDTIIDFKIVSDTVFIVTTIEKLKDTVIYRTQYIETKIFLNNDSLIEVQSYLIDSILSAKLQVKEVIKYIDKPFKVIEIKNTKIANICQWIVGLAIVILIISLFYMALKRKVKFKTE